MLWHLEHNRALHTQLVVLTVNTAQVPRIAPSERLTIKLVAPNFWRIEAVFGFMDLADIPPLLATAKADGCDLDLHDVTYYVGHASIVHREDGKGLPRWQEGLYAFMERNSSHVADILRLPHELTVEIGRHVEI
jgi:KUP system potassium uptake protein